MARVRARIRARLGPDQAISKIGCHR
jgi:hypothetical protein